nr:replication-associated recombination protein A [Desulfitibacter alkalitolerans]
MIESFIVEGWINMDLFSFSKEQNLKKSSPLAVRMRPRNLDEFIGQEHILGKGRFLRRAIEADRLGSIIFYGPPGSGKTTLAKVISNLTKSNFQSLNAVTSGVGDLRQIIKAAEERLGMYNEKTILFIDEIHRFNKSQQDALLPSVEDGTLTLIGATTENPYFEINGPLRSRSRIFQLASLNEEQMEDIINLASRDEERGLGKYRFDLSKDAMEHLIKCSGGDARIALNSLEMAVLTTPPNKDGVRLIDLTVIEDCLQRPKVSYDKKGDYHYDVISAFIKSIRGSDPQAAIHYLARMLDAGEDPRFIARRMIVHASEDIGMADPQALQIAVAAFNALEFVGMPEARINLAQAAIHLALAPKSNSVITAIDGALHDVRKGEIGEIPIHLADSHYKGAKELGRGVGYLYPHDFPDNWVKQQYLPDKLKDKKYYIPKNKTEEKG